MMSCRISLLNLFSILLISSIIVPVNALVFVLPSKCFINFFVDFVALDLTIYHLKILGGYFFISFISMIFILISLTLYLLILLILLICTIIIYWHMSDDRIKKVIFTIINPVLYISILILIFIIEFAIYGLKF